MEKTVIHKNKRKSIWKDSGNWQLFLLCIPALAGYTLFNYIPLLVSVTLPFKDYKFSKGILGSSWNGLNNFSWVFKSASILRAIKNTVYYSIWFMVITTLVNVIIALLLFEIKKRYALKIYQTIITFPAFMSMVVVGYIAYAILSPTSGCLNNILKFFGQQTFDAYMHPEYWPAILTLTDIWKGVGMGSMVYFAALMGLDGSYYEAAEIDGAKRIQKMWYISLPGLIPLICIFTILAVGGLFSGNFDLFYIIPRNVTVLYATTDILPTYIYRALQEGTYSVGAAVSLLQSVAGAILIVVTNLIVKKISPENSMF